MNKKLPFRPVLNIPKSKFEKVIDMIGISLFLMSLLFLLLNWGSIPEKVAAHFNAMGEVDRWGSKFELIILPIMGTFLFILMSLLEKAPHMHNYPKRLNESNVYEFYTHSRRMLNIVKNMCLMLFAYLIVQIVRVALGDIQFLGSMFIPVLLIGMFGAIIIGIYKQSKIK